MLADGAKLVDAAHPAVGQDEGAGLEVPLARVFDRRDREPSARGADARGRHRARAQTRSVLEELGLARSYKAAMRLGVGGVQDGGDDFGRAKAARDGPGSPTSKRWISPRMRMPDGSLRGTPPISASATASLTT